MGHNSGNLRAVAETLIVEQLTPLAITAAMKEFPVTSPDLIAHLGSQILGPFLHTTECGSRSELLDPFVGRVDR